MNKVHNIKITRPLMPVMGETVTSTEETKITSTEDTKITSTEDSKITSTEGTKTTSTEETNIISTEETKITSTEETKITSTEKTKSTSTEDTNISMIEGKTDARKTASPEEDSEDNTWVFEVAAPMVGGMLVLVSLLFAIIFISMARKKRALTGTYRPHKRELEKDAFRIEMNLYRDTYPKEERLI